MSDKDTATKVAYVREQAVVQRCLAVHLSGATCAREDGHDGNHHATFGHTCHWPGCKKDVPPAMWGCKPHWFRLPRGLRNRIWATYQPGQEVTKTPSDDYLEAARAVQDWIRRHE